MEADLQRRRNQKIEDAVKQFENNGQEFLGDDEDLLDEGDGDDNTIPGPVAWSMFLHYKGWSDEELDRKRDCVVFKEWKMFQYMLAAGHLQKLSI